VTVVPVASVTVNPPSATITLTQTQALTATLKDAKWQHAHWAPDHLGQQQSRRRHGVAGRHRLPCDPRHRHRYRVGIATGWHGQWFGGITVSKCRWLPSFVYPTPNNIFATAPGNTVQLQDSTKDASGNNLTGRPRLDAGQRGICHRELSGLVTATDSAAGTATITATSADGRAEARRSLRSGMPSRLASTSSTFHTRHAVGGCNPRLRSF